MRQRIELTCTNDPKDCRPCITPRFDMDSASTLSLFLCVELVFRWSRLPGDGDRGSVPSLVKIGEGKYSFPFRTRRSSPQPPMVVGPRCPARVGDCQVKTPAAETRPGSLFGRSLRIIGGRAGSAAVSAGKPLAF